MASEEPRAGRVYSLVIESGQKECLSGYVFLISFKSDCPIKIAKLGGKAEVNFGLVEGRWQENPQKAPYMVGKVPLVFLDHVAS